VVGIGPDGKVCLYHVSAYFLLLYAFCCFSPSRSLQYFKGRTRVLKVLGLAGPETEVADAILPRSLNRELVGRKKCMKRTLAVANTSASLFQKSGVSPWGLLEELFRKDPWRLLLSAIMLNRTTRCQVDVVLYAFLERWPDAKSVSLANEMEVADVILPLGLRFKRSQGIIRFSKEWLELLARKASLHNKDHILDAAFSLTREDVLGLYNCGDYAYDAYRIFVQNVLDAVTTDHALQIYVDYHRGIDSAATNTSATDCELAVDCTARVFSPEARKAIEKAALSAIRSLDGSIAAAAMDRLRETGVPFSEQDIVDEVRTVRQERDTISPKKKLGFLLKQESSAATVLVSENEEEFSPEARFAIEQAVLSAICSPDGSIAPETMDRLHKLGVPFSSSQIMKEIQLARADDVKHTSDSESLSLSASDWDKCVEGEVFTKEEMDVLALAYLSESDLESVAASKEAVSAPENKDEKASQTMASSSESNYVRTDTLLLLEECSDERKESQETRMKD